MKRGRLVAALVASALVIGAVVLVITLSVIPLPDFDELPSATLSGSLAFVSDDNCVHLAQLETASVSELRCEPERSWIEHLAWTEDGIEATTFGNVVVTKTLDPATGEILETVVREAGLPPEPSPTPQWVIVDRPQPGVIVLSDSSGDELLRIEAPERYWIEPAAVDDGAVAFVDSTERLAVFEPHGAGPFLVAENVRSWPPPVWEP